jgi:rfaE bifunctional protein kinase chain/domain
LKGKTVVQLSNERITEIIGQFKNKKIVVVGDLMLDKYVWGKVVRISPEAPVPVVEVETETEKLGGAANVANNIRSLGGEPILIGVVGNDTNGETLVGLVEQQGCSTFGIITDNSRPTTTKTRVIAHNQHVVRIDSEQKKEISETIQDQMLDILQNHISAIDGMIIEDYNKGVVVRSFIQRLIEFSRKHQKIITVDPKFNNFFEYRNVTVFKPNRKETEDALGKKLRSEEEILIAGKDLLERLRAETVLLTRGDKGMTLFEKNGDVSHVETQARHVADVSGAGDTVIATLTMALVSGATMKEAATLANHAAGVVCGEVGIVPIELDALKSSIVSQNQ